MWASPRDDGMHGVIAVPGDDPFERMRRLLPHNRYRATDGSLFIGENSLAREPTHTVDEANEVYQRKVHRHRVPFTRTFYTR